MTACQLEANEQVCPDCHGHGVTGNPTDSQSHQCQACLGFGVLIDGARP